MAFNVLRVARRSFHSASSNPQIQRAAAALQNADYLIIAAGPGLDVGDVNRGSVEMLPDYRRLGRCYSPDTKRWWLEHYPYLAQDRIFPTCDTNFFPEPELFQEQPHVAWGFWGQLFSSYWSTESQTWDANNVRHVWPEAGGKHNLWVYQIIWKWVSQARNLSMAEEVNAENLNLGDVGQTLVQRNAMKNLKSWSIFTSNVSGQFQKYGFDDARIMETHGNFHFLQCSKRCSDDIWPASKSVNQGSQEYWDQLNPFLKDVCSKTRSPTDAFVLAKDDAIVDELGGCMTDTGNGPAVIPAGGSTYLVKHVHRVLPQKTDRQKKIENYLPRCRNCGAIARPTVNMRQFRFNDDIQQTFDEDKNCLLDSDAVEDHLWVTSRIDSQVKSFKADLEKVIRTDTDTNYKKKVVVLEIGGGKNCSDVTKFSEKMLMSKDENIDTTLIRINCIADENVRSMGSQLQEQTIFLDGQGVFEPMLQLDRTMSFMDAYNEKKGELEEWLEKKKAEYQKQESVEAFQAVPEAPQGVAKALPRTMEASGGN